MKVGWYSIIAAILFTMSANARATTVINFDPQMAGSPGDLPASLTAMGNSPGSPVPTSAQLSNQYGFEGVLFSSSVPYVAVVGATAPNGISGVTSDGLLSYADPVTFTFVAPGTTTPGVTNNVSIQADATGIPGQFATLTAFDINNQLLDTVTLNDTGGEVWSIDLPGIHSTRFNFPTDSTGSPVTGSAFGNGTGIALDNLTFGTVTAAGSSPIGPSTPSSVPLPRMVWGGLLIMGLATLVNALRRRMQYV